MQFVSRPALVRSTCQFNLCSKFVTTFTKRSIGAVAKRTSRPGDLFTAFYSTIFAAAALADSKAKERRLHEWDRLITEAREELRAVEVESLDDTQSKQDWYGSAGFIPCIPKTTTTDKFVGSKSTFCQQPAWHRRQGVKGGNFLYHSPIFSISQFHSSSTSENSTKEDVKPEAFNHEEVDLDAPERDISDTNELKLLQTNINFLVSKLLVISKIYLGSSTSNGETNKINDENLYEQLEKMKQRLLSLEESFDRLPIYNYEGLEVIRDQARKLNAILWCICRKASINETSIKLMIAKICYNLLISTVPPNIETYNILMREFTLLERHDFAEEVLQSFWYSRLRPNKISIRLIILHYKATKNKEGLNLLVKKMRGAEGNLMLTSLYVKTYQQEFLSVEGPQVKIQKFDPSDTTTRREMMRQRVFYRSGYLFKKSPRDEYIFDALICATLELKGLRPAIRYISAAVRERSSLNSDTLSNVISFCIKCGDFTSGLKLLMIILSQWTLSGFHKCFEFLPRVRVQINRLLFFCGIDPNEGVKGHLPSRITQYTESMITREIEYPKDALRKMIFYMKIQSFKETLDRISELTLSVGKALENKEIFSTNTVPVYNARIEKALRIVQNIIAREKESRDELSISRDPVLGFKLRNRGLQANLATTISKMEEITTALAMIRVQRCALKLNQMVKGIPPASVKMNYIQNLGVHLGLLKMQLKLEIHLNIWWIRRLGLIQTRFRAHVQRQRLNFIFENLTDVELKTNLLWENYSTASGFLK